MYHYKTDATKPQDIDPAWWIVDATNETVGRIASKISTYLQGKHKACYSSHINCGDKVIVINAEKIRFTGKKMNNKTYLRHTGYPGGQRSQTPKDLLRKGKGEEILTRAIKGMLPKNKLRKPFMENLIVCKGAEHKHEAQQPKALPLT
ncbi:MAG: 50S ribosomal protein L13 [Bacteroidota bacterium]